MATRRGSTRSASISHAVNSGRIFSAGRVKATAFNFAPTAISDPESGSAFPIKESDCPLNAELGVPILNCFSAKTSGGRLARRALMSKGITFPDTGILTFSPETSVSPTFSDCFFCNALRILINAPHLIINYEFQITNYECRIYF